MFVGSLNLDPRSVVLNTENGLVVESEELAADLAQAVERLESPALSYRLELEAGNGAERLVWHGEEDGSALVLDTEPDTSCWKRFTVCLFGLLPIQGQL